MGKGKRRWGKGREAVFSGCISCRLLGDSRKAGRGLSWGQALTKPGEPGPGLPFEALQELMPTIYTEGSRGGEGGRDARGERKILQTLKFTALPLLLDAGSEGRDKVSISSGVFSQSSLHWLLHAVFEWLQVARQDS
jgi:hypothetical protein